MVGSVGSIELLCKSSRAKGAGLRNGCAQQCRPTVDQGLVCRWFVHRHVADMDAEFRLQNQLWVTQFGRVEDEKHVMLECSRCRCICVGHTVE